VRFSRFSLDKPLSIRYNVRMDEENYYEYDEGSDLDNWEDEQVFQDQMWESEQEEWLEQAGEMMMEQMLLPEE
jgi:hypothetical protein